MLQPLSAIALPLLLSVAVAAIPSGNAAPLRPDTASVERQLSIINVPVPVAQPQGRTIRFLVTSTGNEARYRVREQLAGVDFPSDAVGKTNQVTGAIVLSADGKFVREGSGITVDLASIQTDNARRDNFVRRNTLQTDSFPKAMFVPTSASGLPSPLPATGEMSFTLTGDLTIHGVTKPTTWQVKAARSASGSVAGTATTSFTFSEFGMTIPRVGRVLSVDDKITLEYDFTLAPEPAP